MKLVVLGEVNIDYTPQGKTENGLPIYSQNPGGAPVNVACACAKLNVDSAVITKISTSPLGEFYYNYLKNLNILDLTGVVRSDDPMGLAFVTLDEKGDRDFIFYRNNCSDQMLKKEEVNTKLIDSADVYHFSSVSLIGKYSKEATLFGAEYARKCGKTVSFDINYRDFLWDDKEEAKKCIDDAISYADIVKVSEVEAEKFGNSIEKAASYFSSKGVKLTLITLGENGSIVDNGNIRVEVPSYKVEAKDSTGAGDNFMGAFLAKFISSNKNVEDLNKEELVSMTKYANAAGAINASRFGAIEGQASEEDIKKVMG